MWYQADAVSSAGGMAVAVVHHLQGLAEQRLDMAPCRHF